MITTITKIGNSKGIRIPKVLLEESGLEGRVNLTYKNGKIIISPVASTKAKPKKINYEYLVSYGALADWNRPEEDEAWAYLQDL